VNTVGVQLKVHGLVQGVGYRFYCIHKARSLGLSGWVKNNPDGTVSVTAEGDRSLLEEFIKELKVGPPSASVTDIDVVWTPFTGRYKDFEITY
jgi:acylphosphatase